MKKLFLTMVVVMFGIACVLPVIAAEPEPPKTGYALENPKEKPVIKHPKTGYALENPEEKPDMEHPEKVHDMEHSEKKPDMKHGEKAPDMKHPEQGHDMEHPKTEPAMKHGEKAPDMKHPEKGHDVEHPEKGHSMDHSDHKGIMIHEATVDGYKFAYHLIDMGAHTKNMPKMAATHHLMVYIMSPRGHNVEKGQIGYLIKNPDGSKQKAMAMAMNGGFGADISLKKKGKYVISAKVVAGKKTLKDTFVYKIK